MTPSEKAKELIELFSPYARGIKSLDDTSDYYSHAYNKKMCAKKCAEEILNEYQDLKEDLKTDAYDREIKFWSETITCIEKL